MSLLPSRSRVLPPPEPPLACLTDESEQQAAIAAARALVADRVVFGDPYRIARETTPAGWRSRWCWACEARWRSECGTPCWACGAAETC